MLEQVSHKMHRNRLHIILPALAVLFLTGAIAHAMLDVPWLKGRVNDYAGMLSSATIQSLESELKGFEQTDSTQIVVLTVPSLEGEAIEDFSIRVAEAWKIGHKGSDNGAILVIAQKDRKMRIEVGYGLEGRLTDLVSGQIIRNIIAPEFKAGDYNKGVLDGIDAMIATVRGEYKQVARRHSSTGAKNPSQVLIPMIVFLFLIARLGRIRRLVGSIAGGILLPVFGLMFFPGGLMLLLALIPLGFFAGFILSVLGSAMGTGGAGYRGVGYWGGGGGFSSGGFGGFSGGGGGFGGGGASGGW